MPVVVCRHGRCVPASGYAERDLQTSSRDGFHTEVELGAWHSVPQDTGEVKAGVLRTHIPTGITAVPMRQGMDEWDLELGRLWAASQPHASGAQWRGTSDCPRRVTLILCSGSRWRCPSCAPLLGTATWDSAASGLVAHLCLEGIQLGFSDHLLPFSLISELEHFTGENTRAERSERLPKPLC